MDKIIEDIRKIKLEDILIVFLLLQPLFDMYMGTVGEHLDLFGISIITLIRAMVVAMMLLMVIVKQIRLKKNIWFTTAIIIYMASVLVYFICHHFNIMLNGKYFITNNLYNILAEINYILRLCLPIILIYITAIIQPTKQKIFEVIIASATMIALVIIITNIFKVSFAAYSIEPYTRITANVFDWFKDSNINFRVSLSKGWFSSANQIGALLAILFPFTVYTMLNKQKWYMYILIFLQMLAMIVIGTRVATTGWILGALAATSIYMINLYYKRANKLKIITIIVNVLIVTIGIYLCKISPANNRMFTSSYQNMYEDALEENEKNENYIELKDFKEMLKDDKKVLEYLKDDDIINLNDMTKVKKRAMEKYIEDNYRMHYISKIYVKQIYPYTDDPEFWINVFDTPLSQKGDNRGRQSLIIERIKEKNNNEILDTLVGLGATPLNNRGYMIENDIVSHYYNLGIVGIILFILPYILIILYAVDKKWKKQNLMFEPSFSINTIAIIMAFGIGYFAGHVLDELVISIYLATIAGCMVNLYEKGE